MSNELTVELIPGQKAFFLRGAGMDRRVTVREAENAKGKKLCAATVTSFYQSNGEIAYYLESACDEFDPGSDEPPAMLLQQISGLEAALAGTQVLIGGKKRTSTAAKPSGAKKKTGAKKKSVTKKSTTKKTGTKKVGAKKKSRKTEK